MSDSKHRDARRMPDEGCIQVHIGDHKTRGQAWLLHRQVPQSRNKSHHRFVLLHNQSGGKASYS
jgi:hypothetical protein